MLLRCCAFVALGLFVSVASAKDWVPPSPVAQDLVIEVDLSQKEVEIDPLIPRHGGDGLLGWAIDANQADSISTHVRPIRDLLIDYRFNERFEQSLRAKVATTEGLSPRPDVRIVRESDFDPAHGADAPVKMYIKPHYSFDYRLNKLMVQATVSFWERDGNKVRERFVRHYVYNLPLDVPTTDNTARWTSMGATGLANVLEQGLQQITDMIVHDYSPAGRAEWDKKKKGQYTPLLGRRYEGYPVRSTAAWAWVRQPDTMAAKASRSQFEYAYDITGFEPITATPVVPLPMPAAPAIQAGAP